MPEIDVSLELSSVCVVDARGKIVKDASLQQLLSHESREELGVQ